MACSARMTVTPTNYSHLRYAGATKQHNSSRETEWVLRRRRWFTTTAQSPYVLRGASNCALNITSPTGYNTVLFLLRYIHLQTSWGFMGRCACTERASPQYPCSDNWPAARHGTSADKKCSARSLCVLQALTRHIHPHFTSTRTDSCVRTSSHVIGGPSSLVLPAGDFRWSTCMGSCCCLVSRASSADTSPGYVSGSCPFPQKVLFSSSKKSCERYTGAVTAQELWRLLSRRPREVSPGDSR